MRLPVRTAVLLVSMAFVVGSFSGPAWAQDKQSGLSVTTAKTHYAQGEPISVTFTVTNGASTPCQLAALSDGTIQVTALTRDGAAVTPSLTSTYFGEGYENALRGQLKTVGPGERVAFPAVLIDTSIRTTSPLPGGDAMAALWPVGRAGRYQLSAIYAVPSITSGATRLCLGASAVATVSFTVDAAGSGQSGRTVWTTVILVAVGVVVLALLIALLWWARRRRGATAGAAVFLLIAGAAALGVSVGDRPAHASWGVHDPSDTAFNQAVEGCFKKFRAAGGDPAELLKDVDKPGNPHVDIRRQLSGAGPNTTPTPGASGGPGSSTILWNKDSDFTHVDDGTVDPCTELYHELFHAKEYMNGTASNALCGDTGIQTDEVEAAFAENKYRDAHKATEHLTRRTTYDRKKLPKNLAECDKTPTPPPPGPQPVCEGYQGSSCAMNNGDPHLTTFEQVHYDFQAVGEFVAVRSTPGDLQIQTRQSPLGGFRTISVNTAVALRLGPDRLGFYLTDGTIAVHLDGQPTTPAEGSQALPGGGTLTRRPSSVYLGGDAYTITWPDKSTAWVDPIGVFGLRLYVALAPSRKGQVSGLLGSYDGNPANELATREGVVLPTRPTFEQLYQTFGTSWRITQAESMFDYPTGASTDTYTDRSFPDRPVATSDLPAPTRAQAQASCRWAGVSAPALLEACILDVGLTGQTAFAVDAGDTQATVPSTAVGSGSGTGPVFTLAVTTPGQPAIQTFSGTAGQKVFVDVPTTTIPNQCGVLTLRAPDNTALATGCIVNGKGYIEATVLPATGQYSIVLSPSSGATGQAQLRLITAIDERGTIALNGVATATVSQPGATSTLTFSGTAGQKVFVDVPSATVPDQCGALSVRGPDNAALLTGCILNGKGYIDATVLPATGQYSIVLDPTERNTGQAQLHLITATDQQVPITLNGAVATATVAQPGATSTLTFTGTAGQKVFVDVPSATVADQCGLLVLRGPDNAVLVTGCILNGKGSIDATVLPATGQYSIVLDPAEQNLGQAQVRVHT